MSQDSALHAAIAAAAHNRAIVRIVNALVDLLAQSREESLHTAGRPKRSHQDHRRILGAIRRRDEAGARRAMLDHLTAVAKLVDDLPGRRGPGRRNSKAKPRRERPR
jgi:GntR family transcriptional repressor for pyruvate dehydrogenase complex